MLLLVVANRRHGYRRGVATVSPVVDGDMRWDSLLSGARMLGPGLAGPAMLRVCARGRVLWRELPLPLKDCVLTLRVLCACVTLSLLAAVLNRASVRLTLKRGRRTLQVLNHFGFF